VTYFCSRGQAEGISAEFVEKASEVAACEGPLERLGKLLIVPLELEKSSLEFGQRFKVVRREEFALND
jgi:hypothetical protein